MLVTLTLPTPTILSSASRMRLYWVAWMPVYFAVTTVALLANLNDRLLESIAIARGGSISRS